MLGRSALGAPPARHVGEGRDAPAARPPAMTERAGRAEGAPRTAPEGGTEGGKIRVQHLHCARYFNVLPSLKINKIYSVFQQYLYHFYL